MKRLIAFLLVLALTPICTLAESDYMTLPELAAQVSSGWHESYEAHGRTITVDVVPNVPDAPTCPVLSIRRAPMPNETLTAAYTNTAPSVPEIGYLWAQMGDEIETTGKGKTHLAEMPALSDGTPAQADHNPLTYEDAMEIVRAELTRLTGKGLEEWRQLRAKSYERARHYRMAGDTVQWGDYATETGFYDVEFAQLLRGIPLREGVFYSREPKLAFAARFGMQVTDNGRFITVLQRVEIADVLCDDVPLLSFDTAKATLEAKIAEGRVRDVSEMELCYMSFFDPQDASLNVAAPVWRVRAVYAPNAACEYEGLCRDALGDAVDDRPWQDLYFLAQTGAFLDPDATVSTRRDAPQIITWEDVTK